MSTPGSHTKPLATRRYRIKRADRASRPCFAVGDIVYPGRDMYGCASDDSHLLGIEHKAIAPDESGEPFFTIPSEDLELLTDDQEVRRG
jgi:hypothetical protein